MLILTGEGSSFKRKPTQEDRQQKLVGDMTEREKQQARKFWSATLLLDSNISTPNLVPCRYFWCGGIGTSCMGICLVNMVDEGPVAPHSWYLWGINLEQNTWFIACWSRGTLGKAHRQWHHIIHRYCMAKQFGLMHSCTDSCAVAHVPVCCWTATMLLTKAWALAVWQVMKADNKKKTTNQELDVASNHVY